MKLSVLLTAIFAVALLPVHAESTPDAPHDKNVMLEMKPYSGTFTYQASSPVAIQADGFSLVADSGSLQHDLAINLTFLPRKGGTDFPSRMVNVTSIGDGVRILPNGEHFGARYYWPPLGHWLSVDPLAGDYPWISPYAYAAWNPVKYVDPDGREKHIFHIQKSAEMYAAQNLHDDNSIYIFAHGSEEGWIKNSINSTHPEKYYARDIADSLVSTK